MRRRAALAVAALLSLVTGASAHTTSTGLATLAVAGSSLVYRLTLVIAELPEEPGRLLARAADGETGSAERIAAELRRRVTVRADDAPCQPGRVLIQGSRVGDSRVTLELDLACPGAARRLVIRDDWFELLGEHYRTIARIEDAGVIHEAAFTPDAREVTVDRSRGPSTAWGGFFRLGVEHILSGYDHLLFLAALLIRGGGLVALLKIVTAFTLAHSLTLALAVLGVVTLPDRLVETVIAASIVWVALDNVVRRRIPPRRWLVGFLFGLVHGLGFASALGPLALPPRHLALALLGFNLGVETGQALVVLAALPLLVRMRGAPWEPRVVRAASLAVAAAGIVWFVERAFFA